MCMPWPWYTHFTNPPAALRVTRWLLSLGMLSLMSLLRLKMHSPSQLISYCICLSSSMILAFRCAESLTCCCHCWAAQTNSHLVNFLSQQWEIAAVQRNNVTCRCRGKCISIINAACCCHSSMTDVNQAESWIALEYQPLGHYFYRQTCLLIDSTDDCSSFVW